MVRGAVLRELITTILDALGLLLVAASAGLVSAQWIGWGGLAVAGLIVLAASWFAARRGGEIS